MYNADRPRLIEHRIIEIIFGDKSPKIIKDFDVCLAREKAKSSEGLFKSDVVSGARNV
jgi:hypothetical protein